MSVRGVDTRMNAGRRIDEAVTCTGDRLADLPFPKPRRDELVSAGRAEPHHVLPDSGWVSRWIRSDGDVDEVIELFRLNYDRVSGRRA